MSTTPDLSELNLKIGQLFMTGIPDTQLGEETLSLIRDYHPGGIILFSRNIKDPIQLTGLCRDLQDEAMHHQGIPLFLAVDQEGGRVSRLREPFTVFPGNAAIGINDHPVERAREFGLVTATEMKMIGLNMDLAPVVDVQKTKVEKHLAGRTFGEDPEKVSLLGRNVIRALQETGVMAVAKHFPGLGHTSLDPHYHLPKIDLSLEEIERVNLPPFKAAIEEGVSGIMTSHAIYPALDSWRSATLSSSILTNLLRKKMKFDGLIITDDLEMGAVAGHWGVAKGAVAAFEAGADILLICMDQKNLRESINMIRNMLLQGKISFQRLHQSYERIVKVKAEFLDSKEKIPLAQVKEYFKI
ncbi:MAG: beta-N-acetylhexosaminidase [Thermodesulfobacteriota bacterium]|nr:beta-N-acetylhexosaminidase [Thermodesulfobacteriota bacterium]